jgi:hypothetical protein
MPVNMEAAKTEEPRMMVLRKKYLRARGKASSVVISLNEMPNDGLQLRRAISIRAEGKRLLEKHATAPSAARLCYVAPLTGTTLSKSFPINKEEQS